jgi:hypothetical protein
MKLCSGCSREIPETAAVCDQCGHTAPDPAADALIFDDESAQQQLSLADALAGPPPDLTPEAALSPAGTSGWNRRELLAIFGAVFAGALVTFALLMNRGVAAPQAAAAPEAAVNSAVTAASPTVASRAKWSTKNVSRWIGNGRRSFAVELSADNKVAIWQREVRPVLVVRCIAKSPEVFVFTDSAAKIEPRTEDHTVRLSLDGSSEVTERWPDSADHDALFAPDGAALARQLTGARTLQFGFTPHNAPPVVAHFSVTGLAELLGSASRECGGK